MKNCVLILSTMCVCLFPLAASAIARASEELPFPKHTAIFSVAGSGARELIVVCDGLVKANRTFESLFSDLAEKAGIENKVDNNSEFAFGDNGTKFYVLWKFKGSSKKRISVYAVRSLEKFDLICQFPAPSDTDGLVAQSDGHRLALISNDYLHLSDWDLVGDKMVRVSRLKAHKTLPSIQGYSVLQSRTGGRFFIESQFRQSEVTIHSYAGFERRNGRLIEFGHSIGGEARDCFAIDSGGRNVLVVTPGFHAMVQRFDASDGVFRLDGGFPLAQDSDVIGGGHRLMAAAPLDGVGRFLAVNLGGHVYEIDLAAKQAALRDVGQAVAGSLYIDQSGDTLYVVEGVAFGPDRRILIYHISKRHDRIELEYLNTVKTKVDAESKLVASF